MGKGCFLGGFYQRGTVKVSKTRSDLSSRSSVLLTAVQEVVKLLSPSVCLNKTTAPVR